MKLKKVTSLLLAATLVVGMTMTTGCSKKNEMEHTKSAVSTDIKYKKTDLAFTIDDDTYTMADLMFYIYSYEAQIDYYDQMYQYYLQTSYWDMEIDNTTKKTVREDAKDQVIETAIRYEILYKEAVKKDYKLTDEETKSVKENVTNALSSLTKEQIALTGFTEENVTEVQLRWALADKYCTDMIDSFKINKAEIKAGIDKEQYKEYETKCIEISTVTTDDEGKSQPLSDADKAEAKKKLEDVLEKVKAGTALDKVLDEKEEDLIYNDNMSFLPNDEQETTDKKYMEAAAKLKVGEISDIIEGDEAYYIIEMVDDDSTKSFDEAVDEAVTTEQNSRLDNEYEKMKANYNVKINNKVWDKVVMGNNTIVQGDTSGTDETDDTSSENGLTGLLGNGLGDDEATPTDDATN